jgi:hypothetical protein
MTLDEYRLQMLQRIRDCDFPDGARDLIAEARLFLAQCRLNETTLRAFWSNLRADLEVLSEDLVGVPERSGRSQRGAVLAAAQVAIVQLQNELADLASRAGSRQK